MADTWDVVEEKPLSDWDVVSVAPASGLTARQQAEIPVASNLRAPPPPPPKAPSLGERIKGAVETALDLVSQVTGGSVGGLGGTIGGLAGAIGTGDIGTAEGARRIEESAIEGAQRGSRAVKGVLYQTPSVRATFPEGPDKVSETGQEMIGDLNKAMGQMPALAAGPRGTVGLSPNQPAGLRPALQAAGDVSRAAVERATPRLSPNALARASTAVDAGIPVSPHQLSGNKFLRILGDTAEDIPGAGGTTLKRTRKERFSAGLARAIDPESKATVLDDATFKELQDSAGARIGEIAGRTDVPVESFGDLGEIARRDTPDVQGVVATYAADLARIAEENGGKVPGDVLRKLRTEAQTQERGARASKGDLANALDRLTHRIDEAVTQHAPEGDVPALAEARRQYAVSKAIEPLVSAYPTGEFPPTRLKALITSSKEGKRRMARGEAGELGDYARLGTELLREQATSNTAERGLMFHALGSVATAGKIAAGYFPAVVYNKLGPAVVKRLVEAQRRREAPLPERPPPEPGLAQGFEDVPQSGAPAAESPLGDLTPDWETAPGAAPAARAEVVPTDGLVPAVDEAQPLRVQPAGTAQEAVGAGLRGAGEHIPAVPGRPDLPDAMVAGPPAELAASDVTGTAMQAPEAALARRQQLAEVERVRAKAAESPEVAKVLDEHTKALERQAAADEAKAKKAKAAVELRKAAGYTTDPVLKERLLKRALALEADEKVPVGKATEGAPAEKPEPPAKPPPTGEATELPVETVVAEDPTIPVGEAVELPVEEPTPLKTAWKVGEVYVDAKGRRALYQKDGTWKILPKQ